MEDVFLMHFSYPLPYLKHKSSSSGWQIDSSTLACGSSLSGHHGNRALKLWVAGRRHIPYLWAHISTVCKSKSKIAKARETEIFNFVEKNDELLIWSVYLVSISERVWCSQNYFYHCLANPTRAYALRTPLSQPFPSVLQVCLFSSIFCLCLSCSFVSPGCDPCVSSNTYCICYFLLLAISFSFRCPLINTFFKSFMS